MEYYQFPCGCKFPVLERSKSGIQIDFEIDIEKIPLDCQRTWDIIGSGRTTGIFQLESQLGKKLAKELKPTNMEHLSALISIMRPGVLESRLGNKSLTQHYIDRKNNIEDVEHFHPLLGPILDDTYSVLIYQEQVLSILKELAGFTLVEADTARRGIGKKKADIVAKVKKEFIDKAEKLGKITKDEAIQIFDWIEKGQRYLFNKSHAVSYAKNSYLTAYAKAHFPKAFFCSYLRWAQAKLDTEAARQELINDARLYNIDVRAPFLPNKNKFFKIFGNEIYVGLTDIKGVGESAFDKLVKAIDDAEKVLNKKVDQFSWLEYLFFISSKVSSTVNKALMSSGSLDYLRISRNRMLYEFSLFCQLKDSMLLWGKANYTQFDTLLKLLKAAFELPTGKGQPIAVSSTKEKIRGIISTLENPGHSLEDSLTWIAKTEDSLFGCSITCSEIDDKDTGQTNCTCIEFMNGFSQYALIAAKLEDVRENEIKKEGKNKGKKMAFLKLGDNTCILDAVVFSEAYTKYKALLHKGNTVVVGGQKGKGKDSGLVVDKVWQI